MQGTQHNVDTIDSYFLDKRRVRQSFDRAARNYDAAAILQAEVRARMLSRLDLVKIAPELILDAGCGTGDAALALHKRYPQSRVVALDLAPAMLHTLAGKESWLSRYTGWNRLPKICGDLETLPLKNTSADMVWSNLAMQWCNDLDATFAGMHRILKPDGLLMFSTFGPDTLKELRTASQTDPHHVHISRFIDMHDIGDALVRAGFAAPVMDVEHFTLTYDDVLDVMRDLKDIGAHNATQGRRRGLEGKGFLQRLRTGYEAFRHNGKLPVTYEVIYGHAWKGQPPVAPDAPQIIQVHRRR